MAPRGVVILAGLIGLIASAHANKRIPMKAGGPEWKQAEQLVRQTFSAKGKSVDAIEAMTPFPYHFRLSSGGSRDVVIVSGGELLSPGGGLEAFCRYTRVANLLRLDFAVDDFATLLRFFGADPPDTPGGPGSFNFDERNPELRHTLAKDASGLRYITNYDVTQRTPPSGVGGSMREEDKLRLYIVRATLTVTPEYQCSWATEDFETKRGPEPKKKRKLWPFGK